MKKISVILVLMICVFGISGCSYLPVCNPNPNTTTQTNNSTEATQESNQNASETQNKSSESTDLWNSKGEVVPNGHVTH